MKQHSRLPILGQQPPPTRGPSAHRSARDVVTQATKGTTSNSAIGVRPLALYIHVPFCFHKCHYCDFYSFVDTRDQQEAFTTRLARELAALGRAVGPRPLQTVFVGGGTPSLLRVNLWERLLGSLHESFDTRLIHEGKGEFTVECNPETVSPELMGVLRAGHVDRVSIGAQSFNPRHLKTLERWHDPDNVARAIELARAAGIARQSVDLINSIPRQTQEDVLSDLDRALALGVSHLSCYTLTYEPGTAMTKRLELGQFEPAGEDAEAGMYELTVDRLRSAGFHRYEVSNFARTSGDQSLHNLAYWRQSEWLAAGPSAGGHLLDRGNGRRGSWRWKNVPRFGDYLSFDDDGFAPVTDVEPPEPARLLREIVMMGVRLEEGLDEAAFHADVEAILPSRARSLRQAIEHHRSSGLIHPPTPRGRLALTDAGMLLADRIAADLMFLLHNET